MEIYAVVDNVDLGFHIVMLSFDRKKIETLNLELNQRYIERLVQSRVKSEAREDAEKYIKKSRPYDRFSIETFEMDKIEGAEDLDLIY